MVGFYMERYPQHKREIRIPDRDIGGLNFSGFIDGELASGVIVEDKYKSQWTASDSEALALDDQTLGYVDSYSKMIGCNPSDISVEYRITRKPSLRQKVSEDNASFLLRIKQDVIARPEHYFIVEHLRYTDEEVLEWLDDTRDVGVMITAAYERDSWPKNRAACKSFGSLCSFWKICSARDETELEVVMNDNFKVREKRERSNL